MPEGLLTASGVTGAVHDNPDKEPEPTADAPRGWTWKRQQKKWEPRQRGPVKWTGDADAGYTRPDLGTPPAGGQPGDTHDPEPSWLADGDQPQGNPPAGKIKFSDVPQQVKDDIAGLAGLVGVPILSMLQQIDPYCGSALAQSFEPIVDACLPLICRSEKIVRYFTGDKADWLLWGKLALALKPFAQAVLQHHILRTVKVVRDPDGRPMVVPNNQQQDESDHLTPPFHPSYAA